MTSHGLNVSSERLKTLFWTSHLCLILDWWHWCLGLVLVSRLWCLDLVSASYVSFTNLLLPDRLKKDSPWTVSDQSTQKIYSSELQTESSTQINFNSLQLSQWLTQIIFGSTTNISPWYCHQTTSEWIWCRTDHCIWYSGCSEVVSDQIWRLTKISLVV